MASWMLFCLWQAENADILLNKGKEREYPGRVVAI
jgi:hypothetical protein